MVAVAVEEGIVLFFVAIFSSLQVDWARVYQTWITFVCMCKLGINIMASDTFDVIRLGKTERNPLFSMQPFVQGLVVVYEFFIIMAQ